jgi:hypothetical protein
MRRNYSMNSCKTPALADPPKPELEPEELKPELATDGGDPGPMCQQHADGASPYELHPQQLPQLVGFRDPDAHKHAEEAAVAASDPAAPAAAA